MSLGATLTIQALYGWDDSLFDDMELPDALDRDTCVSEIMRVCSAQELLYPDWGYMRNAIASWSNQRQYTWEKLAATLTLEYDPIANYDRREEWTDESESSAETSETDAQSVAAFDAGSMVPRAEDSASGSSSAEGVSKHTGRVSGNIGVTTTQTLMDEERRVAMYNIYTAIAEDFQQRFCLLVY